MNNTNYENKLIDVIEAIVDDSVKKAQYDRTIQARVVEVADQATGKYKLQYQDTTFYAYGTSPDVVFNKGVEVYVLLPGNDINSKHKTILGTTEKLGMDYVAVVEGEEAFNKIGSNCIETSGEFSLCSYDSDTTLVLYDRERPENDLLLNLQSVETYIKQSSAILCAATIKTGLPLEQQNRGNYGIVFELAFKDSSTGNILTRNYVIDVDHMSGNPYRLLDFKRQYSIFDLDTTNFEYINRIYLFAYGFIPSENEKPDDLFFKNIELYGCTSIPQEELTSYGLTLLTPQGTYFDINDGTDATRLIQAQIRIKGKNIDSKSQEVPYYWFRENAGIDGSSLKYNPYGGNGWECLNKYTELTTEEGTEPIIEWLPHGFEFQIKNSDSAAKETRYKCVALYNNMTLSKEIIITRYNSQYTLTIESDEGTQFYYDVGTPTLTCLVNGNEELGSEYVYQWAREDANGLFTSLSDTIAENDEYNVAKMQYDLLKTQIELEQAMPIASAPKLQEYQDTINKYDEITRIEKNKIHNLLVKTISNFTIYKCSVYHRGIYVGTTSIVIKNSLQGGDAYTLIINNGSQVFKYNENGISPASESLENPIYIEPLNFTIYDNNGRALEKDVLKQCRIEWTIPTKNTLIKSASYNGIPESTNEELGTETFVNLLEIGYNIEKLYNAKSINNTIKLEVQYQDMLLKASTDLTFLKEGDPGTNGTEFSCKIVPYVRDGESVPAYPIVTYYEEEDKYELNYGVRETDKWFALQFWHNGEQIYQGTSSGVSIEGQDITLEWSILRNEYSRTAKDDTNFTINKDSGIMDFDPTHYSHPANIVKCFVKYNNVEYYTTLPIMIARVKNKTFKINRTANSGFKLAIYSADGQNPQYSRVNPFELTVQQKINEIYEDISTYSTEDYNLTYNWGVCGVTYGNVWENSNQLILDTLKNASLEKNQKQYKVSDKYNGLCVTNAVTCTISKENDIIAVVHMPVHFMLNRYEKSALNGWDGNSIAIDEEKNLILSPQVGAGKKNADNSFSGILIGDVKRANTNETQTGLFGFGHGAQTIFLDAEDGSAAFGVAGSGQMVISPNEDGTGHVYMRSGDYHLEYEVATGNYGSSFLYFKKEGTNYKELIEGEDYNVGDRISGMVYKAVNGSGLEIDLTDPHIRFGSGKFRVDRDGSVHASEYSTISGLANGDYQIPTSSVPGLDNTITKVDDIENSISYLEISLDTNSINIPTTADQFPLADGEFQVGVMAAFKGSTVGLTRIYSSDEHAGIDMSYSAADQRITFEVAALNQITNITNDYTFEFTYRDEDNKIYTTSKKITVNLLLRGEDALLTVVGGRNYALDTAEFKTITGDGSDGILGANYTLVQPFNDLFYGKTFTVSAELKLTEDTTKYDGTFMFYGGGDLYNISSPAFEISNLSKTKFIKKTYTFAYTDYQFAEDGVTALDTSSIGLRLDGFTGGLEIQKLKIEAGDLATDWSVAFEDLEDKRILMYTTTATPEEPKADAIWSASLAAISNQYYIWQKFVIVDKEGNVLESEGASCIYIPNQTVQTVEEQYKVHDSAIDAPADPSMGSYPTIQDFPTAAADNEGQIYTAKDTNITYINMVEKDEEGTVMGYTWAEYSDWSSTKPVWTKETAEGKYLWVRTKYTYQNPTRVDYSIPHHDPTWESLGALDSNLKSETQRIDNALTGGWIKIAGGVMEVWDNETTPTSKIIIDSAGIGFKELENGKWVYNSVWSTKGTFNAEALTVINLSADEIKDGILHLGAPDLTILNKYETLNDLIIAHPTGEAGDAYLVGDKVHVWDDDTDTWEPRDGGEFILTDATGNNVIAEINTEGLVINADDGSYVQLRAKQGENNINGLCIYDTNKNLIGWTNTQTGTWNVKNQVIEQSLTIGKVKIVQLGNAIGFVAG